MGSKRNRSTNWDEEEKQLFRSVLKEYVHILENKSINTNANKIKTKAWEEVHKKFNELNSRQRDLGQLRMQWKTMKVLARKTYSCFKKGTTETGDSATPDDSVVEIRNLLNPAELLRDHNSYHSDGLEPDKENTATQVKTSLVKITSKKDNDYVQTMIDHSKHLKENEHQRRMEMAEEEHDIKMQIHEEKLKCAILEREILELKKAHLTKL